MPCVSDVKEGGREGGRVKAVLLHSIFPFILSFSSLLPSLTPPPLLHSLPRPGSLLCLIHLVCSWQSVSSVCLSWRPTTHNRCRVTSQHTHTHMHIHPPTHSYTLPLTPTHSYTRPHTPTHSYTCPPTHPCTTHSSIYPLIHPYTIERCL